MKRWLGLWLLAGCGVRFTGREAQRLRSAVGVAAEQVRSAADDRRLKAIAADVASTDTATQKLGQVECLLLQTRAQALGREVAAALPVLPAESARRLEPIGAELQGAVLCLPGAPFPSDQIGKTLREDAERVEGALQHGG